MRTIKRCTMAVILIGLHACQPNEPPSLNQDEVSESYCAIFQMCAPEDERFADEAGCRESSAAKYEQAEADKDQDCIDARLSWESCVGKFETCEEYTQYRDGDLETCRSELDEFYNYCMVV
jgi:hypothetical protein